MQRIKKRNYLDYNQIYNKDNLNLISLDYYNKKD